MTRRARIGASALVMAALGGGMAAGAMAPATAENDLTASGTITVTEPGTVIDAMHVDGAINVKADDVTIKNSVVTYGGYHSIRIFDGAERTQILDTTVRCEDPGKTNGIVFGNYTAIRVALENCRHDFMFDANSPATVIDSSVDGVAYSHGEELAEPAPEPTAGAEATAGGEAAAEAEATAGGETTPEAEPTAGGETTPEAEPTAGGESAAGAEATAGGETTPEAEPTAEAEATAEPAPDTSDSTTAAAFPEASTTGVPAGTELRSSEGLTITEPGTVIDGLHIRGTVTIAADNVTVRDSLIETATPQYPVKVESGTTGALIENVEVDNLGGTGIGIFMKGAGTVRAADIHSAEDGIRIEADDVTVERTYIHDLQRQDGGHHDALQIRRGDDVVVRGNNFQAYVPATDDPMNAAIQIGSLLGEDPISNLLVENNLFNGGNFTINGGRSGDVDGARYAGNHFGRDFRYEAVGNVDFDVVQWDATNVWHDTGLPVR